MLSKTSEKKYSDTMELFKNITQQILQGNYTNVTVLFGKSFWNLLKKKIFLTKEIEALIRQCHRKEETPKNLHAKVLLGLLYHFAFDFPDHYNKAIIYYEEAISLNSAFAMNNRAFMHQLGQGEPVDFAKAIKLYDKAIELGFANSMSNRAYMYQQGQGGPVDFAKAINLLDKAVVLGCEDAMSNRADMHRQGQGGPIDFAKAVKLYNKAIELGEAYSMYCRAYMYEQGQGGPVDFEKAIKLYDKAIELGWADAMNNRADMHRLGQGGSVDFAKAIKFYNKAIDLNNAYGMHCRAYMYQFGQGGPVDFEKAIKLYDKAIELGFANSMSNRAYMHQFGQGGAVDLVNALWLYEQAYKNGYKQAEQNIITILITKEIAEELLSLMWEQLVSGEAVTEHALTAFCEYGREVVLVNIKNSSLASSLAFLKQLKLDPSHPVTQIITGKTGFFETIKKPFTRFFDAKAKHYANEFRALMIQASQISQTRAMFFSMKPQHKDCHFAALPNDLKATILCFAQPGLKRDKAQHYYKSGLECPDFIANILP